MVSVATWKTGAARFMSALYGVFFFMVKSFPNDCCWTVKPSLKALSETDGSIKSMLLKNNLRSIGPKYTRYIGKVHFFCLEV